MPKNKTFKSSLLLGFMMATFVPLLLAGYVSYYYLSNKIKESGQDNNELQAISIAAEISTYLRDPLITLRQAAIVLNIQQLKDDEVNNFLNLIVADSDLLETIYVIDDKRTVKNIGITGEYRNLKDNYLGIDLSGLSILRNIEYLQGPYWSQSFLSPISGKKSVALIYPASSNSYFVGLFNIATFHSILSEQSKKADVEVIVLDEAGKSVFHPDLKKVEQQQNFANMLPYISAQLGNFGTYEYSSNNIKYLGSTANIPETEWLVLVTQPLAIARLPMSRMNNFFISAIVISILVVVPLALRKSQRLLRPLQDLQENIQAVADGNYHDTISRQHYEEFEQVATHFRNMATAIERREQLLEINEERLTSLLELHTIKQLAEDQILEFALEQAVNLTRSEAGYLHFIDSDENDPNCTLWSPGIEEFCDYRGVSLRQLIDMELWNESIGRERSILTNRDETEIGKGIINITDAMVQRQLSVPIFDGEKIVAVAGAFNKMTDYDTTDARQLSLYFNTTWDIIQQKRSDKDRIRLSEQLAQAQRLEAIGTLAGGIAHDFNNVLMVIIGNTEMARDNIHSPDLLQKDLDEIFDGALRARDLVNQILAFSRSNPEGLKPLDIKPIVKEAVKLLRSSIPANIRIKPNIAECEQKVLSEPGQINQIIMNLCTNAYQAMENMDGELGISLQPVDLKEKFYHDGRMLVDQGQYIKLTISDTGIGIPEEDRERIFEPYFSTREKERGTGLGLAVVHGIVNGLKGGIIVESELQRGTVFMVYLPVLKERDRDDSQILTGNLPGGDEHILYVDDDVAIASVNSRMLESLGYTVTTFSSSKQAWKEYKNKKDVYDLVITDMAMPEMTGEDLARRIKRHNGNIPIIICTGYSEKINREKARSMGVRELLMKPVTKIDLALTVRKVLGYSQSA